MENQFIDLSKSYFTYTCSVTIRPSIERKNKHVIDCECGGKFMIHNRDKHFNTSKHKNCYEDVRFERLKNLM